MTKHDDAKDRDLMCNMYFVHQILNYGLCHAHLTDKLGMYNAYAETNCRSIKTAHVKSKI